MMEVEDEEEEILFPIQYQDAHGIGAFDYIDPHNFPTPLRNILEQTPENCERMWKNKEKIFFNQKDNHGRTSLHIANMLKMVHPVRVLLKHISPNVGDFGGNIALHYCKSYEAAKLLCDAGSNVNYANNELETPLHKLTQEKVDPSIIVLLLERGADTEAQDYALYTPLHNACYYQQTSSVQILLHYGADANAINDLLLTPHMIAADTDNEQIIRELWPYLDARAVDQLSYDDKNLLSLLLKNGLKRWALRLLHEHPEANVTDNVREVLEYCVALQDSECLRAICARIKHKSWISLRTYFTGCGFAFEDFVETLHALLANGTTSFYRRFAAEVNVDLILETFSTRFQCAQIDHLSIMTVLISYGLVVDADYLRTILLCSNVSNKFQLLRGTIELGSCMPLLRFTHWKHKDMHKDLINLLPFYSISVHMFFYNSLHLFDHVEDKQKIETLFKKIHHYLHFAHCPSTLRAGFKERAGRLQDFKEHVDRNLKLMHALNFPSLVEISRNAVRLNLTDKFRGSQASKDIFLYIYNLDAPQRIKDVLFFNTPIYKCEFDCCK